MPLAKQQKSTDIWPKKNTKTKTFRFLDLPTEIRQLIYESFFAKSRLEIEHPNCNCGDDAHGTTTYLAHHLPQLLVVSKQIRSEALPFFSAGLTAVAFELFPNIALSKVPKHYLERVTKIVIDEETVELPDKKWLPALEEVRIHLCWDCEIAPMMYLDLEGDVEDAVDRLMAGYEEKQVSHFVKEAQQKGALPYKVVLHGMLQVGCLEHDCAGEEVWEGITVDLESGKMLSCGPKPATVHSESCPTRDDSDSDEDEEGGGAAE